MFTASQIISGFTGASAREAEKQAEMQIAPFFYEAMKWLQDYTAPDAVIMPNPNAAAAMYLYSGRKTVLIAHADYSLDKIPTRHDMDALGRQMRIDYGVIVRGALETPISRAMYRELSQSFPIAFENEMVTVYDMREGEQRTAGSESEESRVTIR